ncbi:hypothetical protein QYM36_002434 [Artemia franciscana]|uniref:Uncharacterized protein n=1 Tax=Artemia franciscana TaxID=6661 RepID=A0AA88I9T0_ARTSF|nr:hypothetical protein QYM36_002434 [Artemia franciscana]
MSLKEQDKGNVRKRSQTQAEQRLAKYKAEEMDEERLMSMFRASMKVSMETIQVELERERETSRRQMQQQLKSLTLQFTPLVQAVQTNQSAIQNASVTAENTTIQIVKFTDGMDIDAYLTTFERTTTQNNWSRATWAVKLQALLTGKSVEAAAIVPTAISSGYDLVKEAILRRF